MEVSSAPSVIDLDALLAPISEDSPSGENLQYSGLYDEIREARRADDQLARGDWQQELKTADFRQVIDLAVPALTSQTKDLQIAVWLTEALSKQNSFAGLRDGLKLVTGIHVNFWDTCFPEIDDGDQEARANALEWMDRQAALAVREAPITSGEGLSFIAFEESKRFDIPESFDGLSSEDLEKFTELKSEAERFKRVTGERWRKAKAASRRAFYEQISLTLDECWAEQQALDKTLEEKFDRNQMPGLSGLKKSLDEVRGAVKKLLLEKRELEPDESDTAGVESEGGEGGEQAADGAARQPAGVQVSGGAIRTRQDALKRLSEVAEFFRKSEPHSPVSYLVQRAVKWGNMPLETWLQDVIKDEAVLGLLKETLGLTGMSDSAASETDSAPSGDSW
jgi:type VI secretion system protein ImpA